MKSRFRIITFYFTIAFACSATAQTRVSYFNPAGPFASVTTDGAYAGSSGQSGVIVGFGERFNLGPGKHVLDSIDFYFNTSNPVALAVEITPVKTFTSGDGVKMLPDLNSPDAKTLPPLTKSSGGMRSSIGAGAVEVPDSFFILLITYVNAGVTCRASKSSSIFNSDTARAVLIAQDSKDKTILTDLLDGNLLPSSVNADMDIGITYKNADDVKTLQEFPEEAAIVFPNPVKAGDQIHFTGTPAVSAKVYDATGCEITLAGVNLTTPVMSISTKNFSTGLYNVLLHFRDGSVSNLRFIVQ